MKLFFILAVAFVFPKVTGAKQDVLKDAVLDLLRAYHLTCAITQIDCCKRSRYVSCSCPKVEQSSVIFLSIDLKTSTPPN